jgi:serine/threonine protein kinase
MSPEALHRGYDLQDYTIESVLGTGGFGITYLAQDNKLGTRVAIKEFFPQGLASRNAQITIVPHPGDAGKQYEWGRQQFLKEARALAQFKHNNIVRVLLFLELNGTAYMIMEYEAGQGLHEHIRKNGPPSERLLLQVFVPILNGLHAVHRAGLLHLDIKPDNIYLRDEGTPILIDFGSVRNAAHGVDAAELVALTPAYAAIELYPNQGKAGPWTDVYSIGASLYRCISGKEPVDAMSRQKAVRAGKPDPLTPATRLEAGGYSAYLRECIDWAMQIEPLQRPKSAVELQEALMGKGVPGRKKGAAAQLQTHQPRSTAPGANVSHTSMPRSQMPPPRIRGGASSPAKRNRTLQIALLLVAVAAAVIGIAIYPGSNWQAAVIPQATEHSATNATAEVPKRNKDQAQTDNAGAGPGEFSPSQRLLTFRTLSGHKDSVEALAFLDGGARLASAGVDGVIRIWDVERGKIVRTLTGHRRSVIAVAVSPDGKLLVSAGNESELLLWDPSTGKRIGRLAGHAQDVYVVRFSTDGRWLASGGRDRTIIIWDMAARKPARRLEGHEDSILALAFSPSGNWLLSGGKDGLLRRWSLRSGKVVASFPAHRGQLVSAISYSPDGKRYASAGIDGSVRLWDAASNQQLRSFSDTPGVASALAFTPDGRQLVAAGSDHSLRIWDLESGFVDHELAGHGDEVQGLALSPDRKTIASAGKDKTIRLWRAEANASAPR